MTLFDDAAHDDALVVLEGFHALKHAVRFGAEILAVLAVSEERLGELARTLAPDILPRIASKVTIGRWQGGPAAPHWTGVWAVARKREYDVDALFTACPGRRIVLLEQPHNLGNIGACIRVAAGADAGGVVIVGDADPWAAAAVRGAAGLQYAIPTVNISTLEHTSRPIAALDPEGDALRPGLIPTDAIVAFGTEREGLSEELLARAAMRLRIPMRAGVSSLNLAVTVGIALYAGRS